MPYKDKQKRKAYLKARREKAKKLGLCSCCCIREPQEGYKECSKCAETKALSRNNHTYKYKAQYLKDGRCQGCGRPMFDDTHKTCMICRRHRRDRWS